MTAFDKLEALGNDFVVIDERAGARSWPDDAIRRIADRRLGVGCDQVLLLRRPRGRSALAVEIRNADGSAAEQCGNGMRALAAWLRQRGELTGGVRVETPAGPVSLRAADRAGEYTAELPGARPLSAAELGLPEPPPLPGVVAARLISMGNPHLLLVVETPPDATMLDAASASLAQAPGWRDAVNIGLVQRSGADRIRLRVRERGSGPTPACGSGACAAAWLALRELDVSAPVAVDQPGGTLVVDLGGGSGRIRTAGPAAVVFQGRIE